MSDARMGGRRRAFALALFACALGGIAGTTPAPAETLRLFPDDRPPVGIRNLIAPFGSLVLGPRYWYAERRLLVETTPPDALLDLFYVRASFQKRFEQAHAPLTLILPSRVDSGPRDSITIRAFVEGHRIQDVSLRVDGREERVLIELAPLSNMLEAVAHTYLGGRATLSFLTREIPVVRVQPSDAGFQVVLNETAKAPGLDGALHAVRSPLIESIGAQQLGEDLLVQVRLAGDVARPELRARQGEEVARGLHSYSVDLVPAGGGAGAEGALVRRAQSALARIEKRDVTGCAAVFDEDLRGRLDPEALARALSPRGSFVDPYLRAAMKRLGEVSPGGVITLSDGTRYRASAPIELAAAVSQAAAARGYLALLRRFTEELETAPAYRREMLRSLLAPELEPADFAAALDAAELRERECRVVRSEASLR
jgi:hypothetical protein